MSVAVSSEVIVRPCQPKDIAAITAIYGHAVLHGLSSYEFEPPTEAEMTQRFENLMAGNFPYLVAEMAGQVMGYAYAGPYRTRPGYRYTVENSVYLQPDCLGRGIGYRLLSELIERCTELGFRQMLAVVGDPDNQGSIRLHEKLGFVQVGCLPSVGWKKGKWLDSTLMQRSLGLGDDNSPELA